MNVMKKIIWELLFFIIWELLFLGKEVRIAEGKFYI